jgi:autotransporter-associated beta strand protein
MRKTASALLAAALLGASVSGETMSFAPAGTFTVNTNLAITGATTVDVASGTVVFAGVVSGSGGLTKRGAGTLYLANRANTYDGLMTVSAGALYCRSFAAVTLNGGSLRLYGSGMFETDQPIHQGGNSQVYVSDATDTLVVNGPWTGRCAVRGGGTCRFMRRLTASDISTCVRTDKGVTEFLCPTNSFTCDVTANDGTFRVVSLAGKGAPSALGVGNQITLGQREYKNIGCISYCGAADARCNRDITVCGYTNSSLTAEHYGGRLRNETVGTCVTYDGAFTVNCRTESPKAMPTLYLDGAGDGRIESGLPARMLLIKEGMGTWTLAGANALTGGVSVLAGRLDVDGSVTTSCVVANGAAFGGAGSVSQLTLASGARLAFTPGRTPLVVGTLACGGAVEVDVLAAASPGTYTLMTWTNSAAPTFSLGDAPRRTFLEVAGNTLRLRVVEGNTYTLKENDAIGTSSFNSVGHWVLESDGTTPADSPPCAGNDYVLSRMMRSPEDSSVNHVVFGGDSLTLTGSGNLMWKMKTGQSMTVSNLVVAGTGMLNNGRDKTIARLRGRISIASGRTLRVQAGEPNSRGYVVESDISGGADTTLKTETVLTNTVVSKYKSVSYEGDNRGFLGRHQVTGNGQFYVTRQENLGTPPATLRADSMTFWGTTWCVTNDLTLASTNWGVTVSPFTPNAAAVGVDRTLGLCFSVSASRTATLACPFFGTAPIVKDGAGTLVLAGALGGHGGGMRLVDGALGFGARAMALRTLDCRGGKLLIDLTGASPEEPRVTFTESLVVTNGATIGVKLAQAALAPGESYALVRVPGTTLSTLKANSRLSCETYGGVKGVFAVASGGDGTETLTFTATNTVTEANKLPLVPRADLVADVRALGPHPRLFADAAGFQALRDGLSTNALLRQGAEHVAAAANRLLASAPVEYKLDVSGKRLLDASRTALFRISTLAMAYRLYGNAAHLSRAVEEMRAVCAFETWHPSHFLDVAEMSLAVAIGYDWLWEYMDAPTRAEIAAALRKYGLDASREKQSWITAVNNWGQVCHAGILAAALALAEEDPVGTAAFVQRCIERLPTPMAELAPNGNYPEGPGYWNYGMEFNVVAIALLEHAFGKSYGLVDMPGFRESGAYMDLVTGPSGATFNYADGSSGRSATFAIWWYAARFGRPDLLAYRELDLYRSYTALTRNGAGTNRLFPLALFWVQALQGEGRNLLRPSAPLVWDSQGKMPIAIQRSSWDDETAMFVGLKGGSPSGNHGHMDGGSFILDAHKIRWAIDLGSESYSPIEANPAIGNALWTMTQDSKRWWVFRLNTWSHNVPMIDGCQQWVKGSGAVTQVTEGPWGSRAVLDLSSLYTNATSVVRTGTMSAGGSAYRLQDSLRGVRRNGVVRWAMITKATPQIDGPRVTLHQDGKVLFLDQDGAQRGAWQAQSAAGPNSWDNPNTGCTQLYFTVTAPSSGEVDVAVRFSTGDQTLIFFR